MQHAYLILLFPTISEDLKYKAMKLQITWILFTLSYIIISLASFSIANFPETDRDIFPLNIKTSPRPPLRPKPSRRPAPRPGIIRDTNKICPSCGHPCVVPDKDCNCRTNFGCFSRRSPVRGFHAEAPISARLFAESPIV